MAASDEALVHILDLLAEVAPVPKRMFGGLGLFHQGVMFGLMDGDALYLKADDETLGDYEAEGSGPFVFNMSDRQVSTGYYEIPATVAEDQELAVEWARKAIDVAFRADAAKPPSKRKRK